MGHFDGGPLLEQVLHQRGIPVRSREHEGRGAASAVREAGIVDGVDHGAILQGRLRQIEVACPARARERVVRPKLVARRRVRRRDFGRRRRGGGRRRRRGHGQGDDGTRWGHRGRRHPFAHVCGWVVRAPPSRRGRKNFVATAVMLVTCVLLLVGI